MLWLKGEMPLHVANKTRELDYYRGLLDEIHRDAGLTSEEAREQIEFYPLSTGGGPGGSYFQVQTPTFSTYGQFRSLSHVIGRFNEDPRAKLNEIKIGIYTGPYPSVAGADAVRNLLKAFIVLQPHFETATLSDPERLALAQQSIPVGVREWLPQHGFESDFHYATARLMVRSDPRPTRQGRQLQPQISSRDYNFFVIPTRPDPQDPAAVERTVRNAYVLGSCLDKNRVAATEDLTMELADGFMRLCEAAQGDEFRGIPRPDAPDLQRPRASVVSIAEARVFPRIASRLTPESESLE